MELTRSQPSLVTLLVREGSRKTIKASLRGAFCTQVPCWYYRERREAAGDRVNYWRTKKVSVWCSPGEDSMAIPELRGFHLHLQNRVRQSFSVYQHHQNIHHHHRCPRHHHRQGYWQASVVKPSSDRDATSGCLACRRSLPLNPSRQSQDHTFNWSYYQRLLAPPPLPKPSQPIRRRVLAFNKL